MNIKNIKSIDLLHKFFKLKSLTNSEEWSEENFKDNEPRLYRYQQLKAIFLAFDIPFDIDKFMSGEFINHTDKKYSKIINNISNDIEYKINPKELNTIFKRLLEYCDSLQRTLYINDGILLCNNEFAYTIKKINITNKSIKNNLSEIENILANIINPENKSFTIKELNNKYGYPMVDLNLIDMNNL